MAIKPRKNSELIFINENLEENIPTSKKKIKREYKSITLPMNKEEYDLLSDLAAEYEQSLTGVIRYALKQLSNRTK